MSADRLLLFLVEDQFALWAAQSISMRYVPMPWVYVQLLNRPAVLQAASSDRQPPH